MYNGLSYIMIAQSGNPTMAMNDIVMNVIEVYHWRHYVTILDKQWC